MIAISQLLDRDERQILTRIDLIGFSVMLIYERQILTRINLIGFSTMLISNMLVKLIVEIEFLAILITAIFYRKNYWLIGEVSVRVANF